MQSVLDREIEQLRADEQKAQTNAVGSAWQTYRELLARRNEPKAGDAKALLACMTAAGIDPEQHAANQRAILDVEHWTAMLRTTAQIQGLRDAARDFELQERSKFSGVFGAWFKRVPKGGVGAALDRVAEVIKHICGHDAPEAEAAEASAHRINGMDAEAKAQAKSSEDAACYIERIQGEHRQLFGLVRDGDRWVKPAK